MDQDEMLSMRMDLESVLNDIKDSEFNFSIKMSENNIQFLNQKLNLYKCEEKFQTELDSNPEMKKYWETHGTLNGSEWDPRLK